MRALVFTRPLSLGDVEKAAAADRAAVVALWRTDSVCVSNAPGFPGQQSVSVGQTTAPPQATAASTRTEGTGPSGPLKEARGCKFADRCPYVMAECHEAPPPLYLTEDDRAVACYLHKDSVPVSGREMAETLATAN